MSRRTRQRLFFGAGILSLALWLCMATAEVYAPFHAWLHGGTIPNDDDCAIVALAHGKIETAIFAAPVPAPVTWVEISPRIEFSVFRPVTTVLAYGRAPPVLPAVS